jgi:hypothetical protein
VTVSETGPVSFAAMAVLTGYASSTISTVHVEVKEQVRAAAAANQK